MPEDVDGQFPPDEEMSGGVAAAYPQKVDEKVPGEETPEPSHEHPKMDCTYEECGKKAVWSFSLQIPTKGDPHVHTEYFCHEHAMSIIVLYAATEENDYKPLFMQAWPIRMDMPLHPVGIFVCAVGHIGRISLQRMEKEDEGKKKTQFALIGNYRRCNSCDIVAQEIMELANATLFGGSGKMVYRKYHGRDKDVA